MIRSTLNVRVYGASMIGEEVSLIVDALRSVRIPSVRESEMQETIEAVLKSRGIQHIREHIFDSGDRIDFLVGSVGVECKVKGTAFSVATQLERYAAEPGVDCLILVTSVRRHFAIEGLSSKPLVIVRVGDEF